MSRCPISMQRGTTSGTFDDAAFNIHKAQDMETMQYEASAYWILKRAVRKSSLRHAPLTQTELQPDPKVHSFHDVRVQLGS